MLQGIRLPTPNATPIGIVEGPDGAFWFAEKTGNKIGRITTGRQDHRISAADTERRSRRHDGRPDATSGSRRPR